MPMKGALTKTEADELATCERTIEQHLSAFVLAGTALCRIRDRKLYRAEYATFEDYCEQRWDISRRRAYQLIQAADVVADLQCEPTGSQTQPILTEAHHILPETERQARPLVPLETADRQQVWAEATKGGKQPTAARVESLAAKLASNLNLLPAERQKATVERAEREAVAAAGAELADEEAAALENGIALLRQARRKFGRAGLAGEGLIDPLDSLVELAEGSRV